MSAPIIPTTDPVAKKPEESPKAEKPAATAPDLPKGPEGTTTLDKNVALEGDILAHEALERIARMIAIEILKVHPHPSPKQPRRIYLLDDLSVRALEVQQASQLQTFHLQSIFEAITKEVNQFEPVAQRETGGALEVGAAAVGAITSLIGLFRNDVSITGLVLDASQEAFLNSITRYLLRIDSEIEIRNPSYLIFSPGVVKQASQDRILARFNALESARFEAAAAVEKLSQRVIELQFLLDPPKPKAAPPAENAKTLGEELALKKPVLESAASSLTQATARWEEVQKQLNAEGSDHESGLTLLARAEELLAWTQQMPDQTYFLTAKCVSLRANFKTRKGLFSNIGRDDSISYSGGAIATYALLDACAQLKISGTHRYRSPYLKFADEEAEPGSGNSFDETFSALD